MNKRFLLAITLCVGLFWIWQFIGFKAGYFKPPSEKTSAVELNESSQDPLATNNEETASTEDQNSGTPEVQGDQAQAAQPQEAFVEEIERRTIILENEHLKVVLDNQGGVMTKATLKDYYETAKKLKRTQLIADGIHHPGEVVFNSGQTSIAWMFQVTRPNANSVVFTGRKDGIEIKKTYTLDENYGVHLEVQTNDQQPYFLVVNEGLQPVNPGERLQPSLLSFGAIHPKFSQVTWLQEGDTKKKDVAKPNLLGFETIISEDKVVRWLGVTDNYFACVFMPEKALKNVYVKAGATTNQANAKKKTYQDAVAMQGEGAVSGLFYLGPLHEEEVAIYPGLENVISFGWAGMLSKGLFVLLKSCHNVLGNWGWSIIILTLFIKLILMPLTLPGIKSSYKMRKLQPKIKKLREKYSGDDIETKQKMNQEMFALYRKEGVNPFGSCITGIVQMPIFFAYFSLLRSAFDLRQADWILWVTDLSAKDHTFILVLIMGATMYFSMQAMQMSVDPMQQRMMKFMPIVFTLFFIGMPSGLILYMITSNIYTMFQTYFFKRRYEANA